MIKKSIKNYYFTDDKETTNESKELIKEHNVIFYDDELIQINDYYNMINRYTLFCTIIYCYIVHTYIDRLYKN